uniref:Ig-like domain-containing protein n=1 Tax=Cyprinus carpio TaxID=7962 RepID=A0A8C2JJS1_CYPCA
MEEFIYVEFGSTDTHTVTTLLILFIYMLLFIHSKVGVSRVSGSSGGRLMIKCEHPQYKTNPKYICKESDGCSERKNPGVQGEWMENGDVSLYDDTRAGVLMVFFRELKAADAGTYRCGVKVSDYTESFTELQLSIRHGEETLLYLACLGNRSDLYAFFFLVNRYKIFKECD